MVVPIFPDADWFAGDSLGHKFEIVKSLQGLDHLCAMTGYGANDAPAQVVCQCGYYCVRLTLECDVTHPGFFIRTSARASPSLFWKLLAGSVCEKPTEKLRWQVAVPLAIIC